MAALGLAAGGGLTFAAVAATAIILVILAGIKPLEDVYRTRLQSCTVHIRADREAVTLADIKTALQVRGGQIWRVTRTIWADGEEDLVLQLVRVAPAAIQDRTARLRTRSGIRSATVERGTAQPGWTDTSSTFTKGEHR